MRGIIRCGVAQPAWKGGCHVMLVVCLGSRLPQVDPAYVGRHEVSDGGGRRGGGRELSRIMLSIFTVLVVLIISCRTSSPHWHSWSPRWCRHLSSKEKNTCSCLVSLPVNIPLTRMLRKGMTRFTASCVVQRRCSSRAYTVVACVLAVEPWAAPCRTLRLPTVGFQNHGRSLEVIRFAFASRQPVFPVGK